MRYNITKEQLEGPKVENGSYPARIDKVQDKKSSTGNPMILVTWTITGTEPPAGSKVFENLVLTPEAMWKVDEVFKSTGFQPEEDGFDSSDLVGLECEIVVEEREYNGQVRPNITSHLPF